MYRRPILFIVRSRNRVRLPIVTIAQWLKLRNGTFHIDLEMEYMGLITMVLQIINRFFLSFFDFSRAKIIDLEWKRISIVNLLLAPTKIDYNQFLIWLLLIFHKNLWHHWWHPKSIIFVHTRFHHFVLVSWLFYKTYFFKVLYGLVHDIVAHINGTTSLACLLVYWLLLLLLQRRWCRFSWWTSVSQRSIVSVCGLRYGMRHHLLLSLTRCLLLNLIMLLARGTPSSTLCWWWRLTQMRWRRRRRKLCLKVWRVIYIILACYAKVFL